MTYPETFEQLYARKAPMVARYQKMKCLDDVLRVLSAGKHGTMRELHDGTVKVGVRHDMDSDCENAVKMAKWEHANGIRSTYFVLHTDWYYRFHGEMTALVKDCLDKIASYGHEIGIHNNAVAAWLSGVNGDPLSILERELNELRGLGHDIAGIAGHGDSMCHKADLPNDQMFTDFAKQSNIGKIPRQVSMESIGLIYEAYHVRYGLYLSDSGGAFKAAPRDIREGISKGGLAVVLMHPLHWALP